MRSIATAFVTITLLQSLLVGQASAETKGEIVATKMIWDQARINRDSDIVRFKDRWFVVCQERDAERSADAVLRVISSADGDQWESVALIKSSTPKDLLNRPSFSLTANGELMLSANGLKRWDSFDQTKPEPAPRRLAMAWTSPGFTCRFSPFKIGLPSTLAHKFSMFNKLMCRYCV